MGALRAMRGALVTAACCCGRARRGSLVLLFVLLAVAGLANAVTQPAINLFMADQVPRDRQGLAFGIKQSAIPAAVLVSGLALPLLALPLGWRPTFAICAPGALAVAVIVAADRSAFAPPAEREPAPRPSRALLYRGRRGARQRGPRRTRGLPRGLGGRRGHRRGRGGLLGALGSARA